MSWNALVDTLLAGTKRQEEIDVEYQSEYHKWASLLVSEIEVFVKQVNDLDLEKAKDRDKLYSLFDQLSTKLKDLRERDETSSAPVEVLIQIEELIESLNESSSVVAVSVSYIGEDPARKAQRKRKKEKRERKRIDRARTKREDVAAQIQELIDSLDEDDLEY